LSTEGLQDGSLSRRTRSVVPKDADSGQRLRSLIEQEREEGLRGKLEEDYSTGFSDGPVLHSQTGRPFNDETMLK
jgi:hypothetical protein